MKLFPLLICLLCSVEFLFAQELLTPFEKGNSNQSTTFQEMVTFYDTLAENHQEIQVVTKGLTDSGKRLKVVLFNANPLKTSINNAPVILFNNGIHPGEPDGIDASMMLMRDLAEKRIPIPHNIIVAVIESYNLGGMLNRNSHSRANQIGPEAYGFRGNARNYDLNRDFIKTDTRNTASFQEIFHWLNPIVFIDTHVSNGADYQHTFTSIATNRERLGGALGRFFHEEMTPKINADLEKNGVEPIPYVNVWGTTPDKGYAAFMDSPRYATGYTTLFNTIGIVTETHMLKPFNQRVWATYHALKSYMNYTNFHYKKIQQLRVQNINDFTHLKQYPIHWEIDSTKFKSIQFKGFSGETKPSKISGKDRLYYNHNKPFEKEIPFYNRFKPVKFVDIPAFYVVPKSEWQILSYLQRNNVPMIPIKSDSIIQAESYKIKSYKSTNQPYEGHYMHYDVNIEKSKKQKAFKAGDYLVPVDGKNGKFLLETLEPEAVDSFFAWNYFDAILGQKEHFSSYVFEEIAPQILKENPALQQKFNQKKSEDLDFANNGYAQLNWIYTHSKHFEKSFLQYPIYRILK